MQLARKLRWQHMRHLADKVDLGWSHQRIGDLIGLTRQRVRAILRSDLTRVWRDERVSVRGSVHGIARLMPTSGEFDPRGHARFRTIRLTRGRMAAAVIMMRAAAADA